MGWAECRSCPAGVGLTRAWRVGSGWQLVALWLSGLYDFS